jgi:hypothetical protein
MRGLKVLLWMGLAYLCIQLVGGIILDYHLPQLRFPSATATFEALSRLPHAPEVICLGSSRFGAGFVQQEIRDRLRRASGDSQVLVFNAAIEAGDLITAQYMLERILDQRIRPRVLVVEVSPETLARRSEWMGQHVARQLTWDTLPGHLEAIVRSGNLMRLLAARFLPLHVHRRQICRSLYDASVSLAKQLLNTQPQRKGKAKKRPREVETTPDHGVPWEVFKELTDDRHDPDRIQAGLPAIRRWLRNYRIGGSAADALDSILRAAKNEGIQVVLVGVPVAKAHRDLYEPAIEQAFMQHMNLVCKRFDCIFVDYRDRIPDELFLDNHHLTRAGGSAFSQLLAEEVLIPLWQRQTIASVRSD